MDYTRQKKKTIILILKFNHLCAVIIFTHCYCSLGCDKTDYHVRHSRAINGHVLMVRNYGMAISCAKLGSQFNKP
jgi:hypothetical protein